MIRLQKDTGGVRETPAIDVRGILWQDGAIVTVYIPEEKKEDAFTKSKYRNMQVTRADPFAPTVRRKQFMPAFRFRVVGLSSHSARSIGVEVHAMGKGEHPTGGSVLSRALHASL